VHADDSDAAVRPRPDALASTPRHPIVIVAVDVRSLANVGILFRVADAVRAERLYLCGITGYPSLAERDSRPPPVAERADREINKTAIQMVRYVPWTHAPDAILLIEDLKRQSYQIVALEQTNDSRDFDTAPYHFPLALVVGHERDGVPEGVLALADLAVQIPMYGVGNSLNVATSCAVCAFEIVRHHLPRGLWTD
jgi:23S rRNA (guanosine2251-2'-O)-methyltransferase